jgi:PAS domain S-box-containing protein
MEGGTTQLGEELALALLDAAPIELLLVDTDARVVFANARAATTFGRGRADLLGRSLSSLVPGPSWRAYTADPSVLSDAPAVRGVGDERLVGRRSDGHEFPVEVTLRAAPGPRGPFVVVVVRDRTERRGVERTLREAEERFRLALDEAPIGMALVGLDYRILRVNRAFSRMLGYLPQELESLRIESITHPDDLDSDLHLVARLARGEVANYRLPKRYLRKDGTVVDAVLTASIVRDPEGAPLYFIGQVEDVTGLRHTEHALERSESNFRALFDQAPEGVFIADVYGRFTDVNTAACGMLGFEAKELIGRTIFDVLATDDAPRLVDAHTASFAPGWIEVWESTVKRKDGAVIPVEVTSKTLPDGRWQAFARDISRRKEKEEELRRVTALLDSIVENVPAMIFVKGAKDLRFERFNRAGEELTGLARDALIGRRDQEIFPPEQARFFEEQDRRTLRDRRLVVIHEEPVETATGTRWLYTMKIPILDGLGRPAYLLGISMDITDRRRIEREGAESLRWLRAVLEQSPVGLVLLHGPAGEGVDANQHAVQMAGGPLGPIERHTELFVGPDGHPFEPQSLPGTRALRGEKSEGIEMLLRTPAGGGIPILTSSAPIVDGDGVVKGAVVAFQDITATKELEHLRAEWGSIVAHDLRQPLNSISLSGQAMARATDDAKLLKYVNRVRSSADRLNRMVGDLMDFSRLDARRLELVRVPLDVAALVKDSVERLAFQAPDRPFEVAVAPGVPLADADPGRIAQVMENLLTNAVKYGIPTTLVDVAVDYESPDIVVAVRSEGKPLAPEELSQLFERFHRTEGARHGAAEGTGLGLYITRSLVEAHGGSITAESTPAGRITFRFTLPAASASPPA